jgi:hypothetical protein
MAGAAVYRSLIRLYPHTFWRTFHDELEQDFEAGVVEAAEEGPAAVARFWARVVADLAVSLVREWLRTPWIPVLIAAASLSIGLFALAAFQIRQWPQYRAWPAPDGSALTRSESLHLLIVMIVGVLIPIVGTIFGSLWMLLLRRSVGNRRKRRV